MTNKMIKSINPVARAMLMERIPKQVEKPKKGKGSYVRKKQIRKFLSKIITAG